jgi:hypothetical protein
MARSDMQFGQDPAYPASKSRWSIDSGSRSLSKLNSRKGFKTSSMEDPAILKHDGLLSREPLPFPEYSDQSLFSDPRAHGSMRSTKTTPAKTPSGSAEKFDSSFFLSGAAVNDFAEGLEHRSHKSKHMKPKVQIKPMLRKMSRDDATTSQSIDLSRSSTEQEGLGIYLNFERERERRQSESLIGTNYRRASSGMHNRSTSGASQFSITTGSSGGKPGSQYVYPLRPTPRSFTPPLSQSYQTSVNESDDPVEGSPETQANVLPEPEPHRMARASSGPMPRLSLQIDDDSFTRLPGISQTNVSGRPSFGYSRDNGSTVDTASPISRPSLDFVFRSRTRTSTDPVSRAATIQAARQAFQEKEAAKARRLEKQQTKAEERQTRRLVKRASPEAQNAPPARPREELSEKMNGSPKGPKRASKVYDDEPPVSFKSQTKSTWVLFMTWLRTRVFKFRRRIRKMA